MHHRADRDDRKVAAFAEDFALADWQAVRLRVHRNSDRFASWVTDSGWMRMLNGGLEHVLQLVLVLWRHHRDVRYTAQIGAIQ